MKTIRFTFLATLLMLLASVSGHSQVADIGTVTITNNGSTFTLTRSKPYNDAYCYYRLVGVTAINGIHFKETSRYNGARIIHNDTYIRFPYWEGSVDVVVNEITDLSTLTTGSRYTNNNVPRKYIFEVLDESGNVIASKERTINYSTTYSVNSSAFNQGEVVVNSGEITVTDDDYVQAYHAVPFENFFISTRPRDWLEAISAELRMTLSLQAKEKNDGYQHVQILVNQTSNHDEGSGNNTPGTMNYSSYMATFCHKGGSTNTTYSNYIFPVVAYGSDCGNKGNVWGSINSSNNVGELRQQLFNTDCRASDGRLIVAASGKLSQLNTVGIRFDASGDNEDTWYANNTVAYFQAVDNKAPEVSGNFKIDKGCDGVYYYNKQYYITIPFNEIVIVSGSPTLSTNWGEDLTYIGGSGTNALAFSGTITSLEPLLLQVKTLNLNGGSIKDVAGNSITGTININQTSNTRCTGGDADHLFNKLSDGSYEISTAEELRLLARFVNAGNDGNGQTFRQTADITNVGFMSPIGYNKSGGSTPVFKGHYDGGGHTISGASITMGLESRCSGLFGELYDGVIENVKLINSAITGQLYVGPIVGYNSGGTVRNCFVGSDVVVGHDDVDPMCHGGVAGYLRSGGIVEGCVSYARMITTNLGNAAADFGGIVGRVIPNTQIKNCLYLGPKFDISNAWGAILGYFDDASSSTISNNYYTAEEFWGYGLDKNNYYGASYCDIDNARKAKVISAGDYVIITPSDAVTVYDVSGITAYGTTALSYKGTLYSGETQTVNLTLSHENRAGYTFDGYSVNAGTLSGDDNPYVLTVPANNVTVSAAWSPGATVDLLAHEAVAEGQTRYWTTFYHPDFNYQLPAGALAFTMKSDKTLYCVGNGRIIPSGCAVVIMTDASALTNITSGSGTLTLTKTTETATPESGNILSGKSSATAVSDVVTGSQKVYILGKKSSTFGFFQFSGSTIPSNKAYYVE
ncbi:MAG: hypothetical protein IKX26_07400 [Bacteroidales bacterium]|nr:hypothetical protein [Bacteroidales bacterium]